MINITDYNFHAIYRILRTLEKAMDIPLFDPTQICHEAIGVSEERWARYMEMLDDNGFIKGVEIRTTMIGETKVDMHHIRITLAGLEYMYEDPIMRRCEQSRRKVGR